ncbi:ATP-binding protein [Amycolatopsis sp. cmx-4-68]|uniref:ATP-binding protein n=1 Tax=Amycolatopsis sp. cmx-4-68 TaxID=2790938 RepID=UPI003979B66B
MPADPGQLGALREDLTAWATRTGLPSRRVQELLLAAYEAMANVVVHAYRDRTGTFALHARCDGDTVTVTVTDHGRWRPAPRPSSLGGRGLPLIHTLADQAAVETSAAGTTVTMTWIRESQGSEHAG